MFCVKGTPASRCPIPRSSIYKYQFYSLEIISTPAGRCPIFRKVDLPAGVKETPAGRCLVGTRQSHATNIFWKSILIIEIGVFSLIHTSCMQKYYEDRGCAYQCGKLYTNLSANNKSTACGRPLIQDEIKFDEVRCLQIFLDSVELFLKSIHQKLNI